MLKHRGFPGRLTGTDFQFVIRRANMKQGPAKIIKRAVTDSDRHITFDPVNRPTVANLLTLAGLCADRDPAAIAEEIGDGGGGGLKKYLTEALNEKLAPVRARRLELEADPGHIEAVLREGNQRANAIADATLAEVREAMGMVY